MISINDVFLLLIYAFVIHRLLTTNDTVYLRLMGIMAWIYVAMDKLI